MKFAKTANIFLLDQSGSMQQYDKIRKATEALNIMLKSMNSHSQYAVIGYGTNYDRVTITSQASDSNVKNQCTRNNLLMADKGETYGFGPLKHAIDLAVQPDYLKNIFLISDGELHDAPMVL